MPTIQKTLRVYNFIENYTKSNGEPPTLREICNQFGFNSPSAAHQQIDKMVERGWVERVPHIMRGILLTGTKTTPKVKCPICNQELEITEFGACKARASGRNLYCKGCVREKVRVQRATIREMKAARKQCLLERKPVAICKPLLTDKIKLAIKGGCKTRDEIYTEIKKTIKTSWDEFGDALLDLAFEHHELRIVRAEGRREFHLAA